MKIFFVDFENVNESGLNGISKLSQGDIVRIYYNSESKIKLDTMGTIIKSPATFEVSRINLTGVKNALDVTLMNDLSNYINRHKKSDFYIVAKDGDYDKYITERKKRADKHKKNIRSRAINAACLSAQMSKNG